MLAPDGTLWKLDHSGTGGPKSLTLHPLAPGAKWKSASGTGNRGLGVKQDGTLWFWQSTASATGSASLTKPPVQIGTDRDWQETSHTYSYASFLKADGSLWFASSPKNGGHPLYPTMQPTVLDANRDWSTATSDYQSHYALKHDGSMWHWTGLDSTPTQIGTEKDWKSVVYCRGSSAALKGDGSLWVHVIHSNSIAPAHLKGRTKEFVRIGGESHWKSIVAGMNSMLIQHKDGSWWASGHNLHSHLGVKNPAGSDTLGGPTRIPINLDVWAWWVGFETTLILARDGTFYYMGLPPRSDLTQRQQKSNVAAAKVAINRKARDAGFQDVFEGPPPSSTPVKIGELPESVTKALSPR